MYYLIIKNQVRNSENKGPDIEVYEIKNDVWHTFATQTSSQVVSDSAAFSFRNSFYVVGGYNDNVATNNFYIEKATILTMIIFQTWKLYSERS